MKRKFWIWLSQGRCCVRQVDKRSRDHNQTLICQDVKILAWVSAVIIAITADLPSANLAFCEHLHTWLGYRQLLNMPKRQLSNDGFFVWYRFIPRLYRTFCSPNYVYLLTEPCLNGDLFSYVECNGPLRCGVARYIVACVTEALRYLHNELGVIHRDVKTENVLIGEQGGSENQTNRGLISFLTFLLLQL